MRTAGREAPAALRARLDARWEEGSGSRMAELVEGLLAGEPATPAAIASELRYHFDGYHTALLAAGSDVTTAIDALAAGFDCRRLVVPRSPRLTWVWLASRRPLESAELADRASDLPQAGISIALGEPGEGLSGWRLTHRQAAAALEVGGGQGIVRYRDVALLAATLRDDVLRESIERLYLAPLREGRGGGETARETLRAYFNAGRNISSAAATLGVKRHTVTNRLREIEASLGCRLDAGAAELELALDLEEHCVTAARRESGRSARRLGSLRAG